jgi:hypothetical protein
MKYSTQRTENREPRTENREENEKIQNREEIAIS